MLSTHFNFQIDAVPVQISWSTSSLPTLNIFALYIVSRMKFSFAPNTKTKFPQRTSLTIQIEMQDEMRDKLPFPCEQHSMPSILFNCLPPTRLFKKSDKTSAIPERGRSKLLFERKIYSADLTEHPSGRNCDLRLLRQHWNIKWIYLGCPLGSLSWLGSELQKFKGEK